MNYFYFLQISTQEVGHLLCVSLIQLLLLSLFDVVSQLTHYRTVIQTYFIRIQLPFPLNYVSLFSRQQQELQEKRQNYSSTFQISKCVKYLFFHWLRNIPLHYVNICYCHGLIKKLTDLQLGIRLGERTRLGEIWDKE